MGTLTGMLGGCVKLPGEDFFGDFLALHESLVFIVQGVELYVIFRS